MEGAQVQCEIILQILQMRFNPVPEQISPLIQQLATLNDLAKLKALAERALYDFTLADFSAHLQGMLVQT